MALYSSRVLFIPSLSFPVSLYSFFYSFLISPSFLFSRSFPISLSSFPSLISSISTSFSLFFFSTSPTSLYFLYISLVIPSFLFSPLINAAPKRRFYTLLLYLLYLHDIFQNTSLLFTLPVYYLFLLSPSLPLSRPISTRSSFPLSLSFPTSLSPFYPLIYSILTLFFFSTSLPSLYYSISSQWLLPSFLISSLINAAPKRGFYTLLLSFLYLQIFSQKTSIALYSSRLLSFPLISFPVSLSSYFDSFLISPSFLLSRTFATSPFPFPSLISSISPLFSLLFFFRFFQLISSIYPLFSLFFFFQVFQLLSLPYILFSLFSFFSGFPTSISSHISSFLPFLFFSGFPTSISLISPLFSLFFFSGFPTSISSYLSIKWIYGCSVRMIPFVMTWDGVVTTHHRRHIVVLRKTLGSMLASQGRTRTEVS